MHRKGAHNRKSVQKFKGRANRTAKLNTTNPMRGGIRL